MNDVVKEFKDAAKGELVVYFLMKDNGTYRPSLHMRGYMSLVHMVYEDTKLNPRVELMRPGVFSYTYTDPAFFDLYNNRYISLSDKTELIQPYHSDKNCEILFAFWNGKKLNVYNEKPIDLQKGFKSIMTKTTTINLFVTTSLDGEEVCERLKKVGFMDEKHLEPFSFIVEAARFKGASIKADEKDAKWFELDGHLVDNADVTVDMNYSTDEDVDFKVCGYIAKAENGTSFHPAKFDIEQAEWNDHMFEFKDFTSIKLTEFFKKKAELKSGLCVKFKTSNVPNLNLQQELAAIHFVGNDGAMFRNDVGMSSIIDSDNETVTVQVLSGGVFDNETNALVYKYDIHHPEHFLYKCIGHSTYHPDISAAIVAAWYNGTPIKLRYVCEDEGFDYLNFRTVSKDGENVEMKEKEDEYVIPHLSIYASISGSLNPKEDFNHIANIVLEGDGERYLICHNSVSNIQGNSGNAHFDVMPVALLKNGKALSVDALYKLKNITLKDVHFEDKVSSAFLMTIHAVKFVLKDVTVDLVKDHSKHILYEPAPYKACEDRLIKECGECAESKIEIHGHFEGANKLPDRFWIFNHFDVESNGKLYDVFDDVTKRWLEVDDKARTFVLELFPKFIKDENENTIQNHIAINRILKNAIFNGIWAPERGLDIKIDKFFVAGVQHEIKSSLKNKPDLPAWRIAEIRGDLEIRYSKTVKEHLDTACQVRGIMAWELSNIDHLEYKNPESQFSVEGNCNEVICRDNTLVCSHLTVEEGGYIGSLMILKGGYATVEEGAHIGRAYVHTGGSLELCSGAVVDHIYVVGGVVYGAGDAECDFAAMQITGGFIATDEHASVHHGNVMKDTTVDGHLTTHKGSVTEGIIVEDEGEFTAYGGYHKGLTLKEGASAFISDGAVLDTFTCEHGSKLVIYNGAVLFNGEIHGKIEYEECDRTFNENPKIVNCLICSDAVIDTFESDDFFEDDEDDDDYDDD